MSTIKISELPLKSTMAGTEEFLINDSGTSKKFSAQPIVDAVNSATSSASSASASAIAAAASAVAVASTYDSFDDRYLGTKASDPALDNDGNALIAGALYFNTTTSGMKVYDGSSWLEATVALPATFTVFNFTATSGQTTFSGADDNAATLVYDPPNIIVTLNGVVLEGGGSDYTATTGSSVVLTTGAATDDEVNIIAVRAFEVADVVPASLGGTFTAAVNFSSGIGVTGNITVTGNVDGRDIASDGSKLDGIESGATADQTAQEIATAIDADATAETTLKSALGLGTAAYTASTDYATAAHNHAGVYEPADATILKDADIGVNVQAYNANLVTYATNGNTAYGWGNHASAGYLTSVDGASVTTFTATTLNATTVDLGNWTITESSGVLYFATGGTNKMKLDASGNLTCVGDVTAYGSV